MLEVENNADRPAILNQCTVDTVMVRVSKCYDSGSSEDGMSPFMMGWACDLRTTFFKNSSGSNIRARSLALERLVAAVSWCQRSGLAAAASHGKTA